ncbi:hypothetical protein CBE90_10745 [Pasteurella multocida]|uniref:hypothetical protein n=1 Tax=Pasteurella multocida TaxID=747 RepID=UPI000CE7DC71|nr:hypothetical protein [Pasteurella multocida]PPE93757.1 hypothetical protein CBE90_10745 [Pasteurella multocida]PPE95008.1 hypothetical protein CBE91_10460 [Pasteurella multocida]
MEDVMSKILALATLAKQQGKSLKISIIDNPNNSKQEELINISEESNSKTMLIKSLSDLDRERIKQAILKSASNTTDVPLNEFAESLCEAIHLIDSYKN